MYCFYIALMHRAASVFHALVFSDAWQIRAVWLVFHCTSVFCANPVCFCVLAVVLCVLRACSVFPYMAWPSPPHTSAETRLTTQGRTVPHHSCQSHNQSIFISGLYTNMLLDMLLFDHSEQSMDSHRQAYFHDRPNISLVKINVKNLSQEYNIYAMFIKAKIIRVSSIQ